MIRSPCNPCPAAIGRVKDKLPKPKVCPHCGSDVKLVENSQIYGRSFGEWPWSYLCSGCGAYTGLHPKTDIPLGTLATEDIREARKRAKALFNPLWQSKKISRSSAYEWLSRKMGIAANQCHFGYFDVALCEKAILIIEQHTRKGDK